MGVWGIGGIGLDGEGRLEVEPMVVVYNSVSTSHLVSMEAKQPLPSTPPADPIQQNCRIPSRRYTCEVGKRFAMWGKGWRERRAPNQPSLSN